KSDYEQAAKYYTKMVALAEELPEAHYQLAAAYLNMARFPEADQELQRSLKLKELPVAVQGMGLVRLLQGKDWEAIPYLERALDIGAKTTLSYINLATAYRRAGYPKDAQETYRAGLSAAEARLAGNPRDAVERAYLASLCARLGDRQRAESELSQALQLSQDA